MRFCKKKNTIYSILVNIVILLILLLFFEPTDKPDDYDMCMVLFGAFSGEYSPFLYYSNPLLGKLMVFLLNIKPLQWYWFIYFGAMFLGFTTITKVLFDICETKKQKVLDVLLLMILGYSFYIRCTFTKVAGILVIAGLLFLFHNIIHKRQGILSYMWGIFLVCIGILVRSKVLFLCSIVFAGSFVYWVVLKKKDGEQIVGRILAFLGVFLVLVVSAGFSDAYTKSCFSEGEWKDYKEFNTARANVMDFAIADYGQYKAQYSKIGVSENDYKFILKYHNVFDTELITMDFYRNIRGIEPKSESVLRSILEGMRTLLKNLTLSASVTFFPFLIAALLFVLSSNRYKKGGLFIAGFVLAGYLYMSCMGRIQEHTNDVLFTAGMICLLYWIPDTIDIHDKHKLSRYGMFLMVFVLGISVKYENIASSDYFGETTAGLVESRKSAYEENRQTLQLNSDDKRHLYLRETQDRAVNLKCFNVFEPYEKGFYHNILDMSSNITYPFVREILKEYGVENPMREITNSENIYYAVSDYYNENVDLLCTYIQEHYHKDAYYSLVKKVDGLNVYRFNEGPISLPECTVDITENDDVQYNVEQIREENMIEISGYAFIEGVDSYSQNIYVAFMDDNDEVMYTFYGFQTENKEMRSKDKYHGRYSQFFCEIDTEEYNLDGLYMKIYIDTGKDVYAIKPL